jgi:hypothetical protein
VTRAVVDPNVVVSGILDRAGVPAAVLRAAGLRYELVWTPARPVLAVGSFAGVMVVSAAEFLATLGEA